MRIGRINPAERARRRAARRKARAARRKPSNPVRGEAAAARRSGPVNIGFLFAAVVAVGGGALAGPHAAAELRRLARGESMRLEAIAVLGARRLSAAEVARATRLAPGTPLVAVDVAAVEERLEGLPAVASARALRLPPGRLVVGVVERQARGVAPAGPSGALHLVCAEGVPFAPASPREQAALPRLVVPGSPAPGRADGGLAEAVAVAGAAAQAGFAPAEIAVPARDDPQGPALRLRGVAGRVLLGWDGREAALARLARLTARRPDLLAEATDIDVRFADRAVLRGGGDAAPEGAQPAAATREGAAPSGPPTG